MGLASCKMAVDEAKGRVINEEAEDEGALVAVEASKTAFDC